MIVNNLKIATLIISSNTYPATRNTKAQKKIYLNSSKPQKDIYWYRQGERSQLSGKSSNLIGNDLFLDISDDTLSMGKKTIMAFEWAEQNLNYDYILRPTPSSYINFNYLENFITKNFGTNEIVYAGNIQKTKDIDGNQIEFVSGSTLLLSKKCVQLIIKNKELWNHEYWDDVGLALLLKDIDVKAYQVDRFDVPGNPYLNTIPTNYYQYRCRADNHYGYPRLIEGHVLKYLHNVTNEKKYKTIKKYFYLYLIELSKILYIYQFGWKVYSFIRLLLRILLPKKIYLFIKKTLHKKITSFKLIRFKT